MGVKRGSRPLTLRSYPRSHWRCIVTHCEGCEVVNEAKAGKALADAIIAERARRDESQREVAAILGTSQQSFGKWENGHARPSDDVIPALARYLGMTEAKVRELRGPMRADPRDRMLLRRRVDELERRQAEQAERAQGLIERLEKLAERLDRLDPPGPPPGALPPGG